MHSNIPMIVLILIISGYVVIAFQFFKAARDAKESQGKKALLLLVGLFILCSICGYVPGIIGVPYYVQLVTHVSLVVVTWGFVFTNQAARIMKALN